MSKDWGEIKVGYDRKPRFDNLVRLADLNRHKNKFRPYRFVGSLVTAAQIWMPIYKDGKPLIGEKGKPIVVPKFVTNYDPETQEFDETKPCPYVQAAEKMNKYLDAKKQIRVQVQFLQNAIDRAIQDGKPRKVSKPTKEELKTGFKNVDSESWTPVEVHQMGTTLAGHVKGVAELNEIKNKTTGKKSIKSISDPKYGRDILLKVNPDAKGAAKFQANSGERTPLSEEELAYLLWDIEGAIAEIKDSRKEAKIEAERMLNEFMKGQKKKSSDDDDEEDDDMPEDIEDSPKKKKNSKKVEDDDDEDLSDDDDEDEDEEEEKPKKGSKKKKPVDDDDDDEEEKPRKGSKKKKPVDDDDDDDDEEEKPKKSSKKKIDKKKKKKVEDDDDDDDDDEGFDELDDLDDEELDDD